MEAINNQPTHFTPHFCDQLVKHYSGLLQQPSLPLHLRAFYKLQLRYYTTLQTRLSTLNQLSDFYFFIQ